jgi:hypothetical protein
MRIQPLLDLKCLVRTKSGGVYRGYITHYHQPENEVVMTLWDAPEDGDTLTLEATAIESVQFDS